MGVPRGKQGPEVDSIDLYRKIHLFFCSSINENWFHANSEFVDNGVAIESRRIKQFIITFLKKSLKKPYLFFKTPFKVFFWRPILEGFVGAQFFHDLEKIDLPPFQNNISSSCSYLREQATDKNRNR